MTLPNTLQELITHLTLCVAIAEAAENEIFFIETWQLKAVLTGKFVQPDDPDATAEDVGAFDDTGDLSNSQIAALVQRDAGEMPTQQCKKVEW